MSSLTKIFIVLQLVCSLVLAVLVVSLVAHQQPYRQDLDKQRQVTFGVQALLQAKTNEVEAARQQLTMSGGESAKMIAGQKQELDRANQQIASLNIEKNALDAKIGQIQSAQSQSAAAIVAQTAQLTAKDDELRRMGPENVSLIQKNAELARQINEQATALKFAETSIRKLQEQINVVSENSNKSGASAAPGEAGTVASLSMQTPAQINGKITSVSPTAGRTLIELPLGTRDGVRKGTAFMIYRGQGYIGDAVVESVYPDTSVAAVDPSKVKKGENVKVGDMVISGTAK